MDEQLTMKTAEGRGMFMPALSKLPPSWWAIAAEEFLAYHADQPTEVEKLRALVEQARRLIQYAAESSTVSSSDDPGCFFCDRAEGHTDRCKAAAWLAAHEGIK